MREAVAGALLAAGVALQLVSCLGVLLMRDAFDRLHYLGTAMVGGMLACAAVVVRESFSIIGWKAVVIGLTFVATSPMLTHVTARALRERAAPAGRAQR